MIERWLSPVVPGVRGVSREQVVEVEREGRSFVQCGAHLAALGRSSVEEVGLIEVVERDRKGLERGHPYRFFQLTEAARELFDRNNLFQPEAYQALFAEVEKTDEIEATEAVERPEGRD